MPLPMEVQLSPAFSVCVGDVDADGNDDLFFSQNFFAVRPEDPRNDAGTGLWLLGRGDGTFRALSPSESGVRVDGEQRGAALADFDHDGRVDLVVTQNASLTRLFRNQLEAKGLRVRFDGEDSGVGVYLRICYTDGIKGPARAVQAGSGYRSANATTQVLGRRGKWRQLRSLGQVEKNRGSQLSRGSRKWWLMNCRIPRAWVLEGPAYFCPLMHQRFFL